MMIMMLNVFKALPSYDHAPFKQQKNHYFNLWYQRRLDNNSPVGLETFIDVWTFQGYGVGSSSNPPPPPFVVVSSLLYFKELCFWRWRIKNIVMHQFFHFRIRIRLTPCKIIYGLDYSTQLFVFCYF